ncbi:MAG TPA: DUF3231 family protein [Oscillospiraceae bacterium]|nr:DUF3231 family protein [Oscillospiraceae bacterium]
MNIVIFDYAIIPLLYSVFLYFSKPFINFILRIQVYFNYAHDTDFKLMIKNIGLSMLEAQAAELEKQCELYGIPMPSRPPKNVTLHGDSIIFSDEYMFRQIFEGCQHFLQHIARCISTAVHNDALREIFYKFFKDEMTIFNNICKYGKTKGYLHVAPTYKAT